MTSGADASKAARGKTDARRLRAVPSMGDGRINGALTSFTQKLPVAVDFAAAARPPRTLVRRERKGHA